MSALISRNLVFTILVALFTPQEVETPVHALISLTDAPSIGDAKARIAIVEFSDYQCPFCLIHSNQALPQIVREYVNTGRVRYFFKDFPIDVVHPQASRAAEAAHCASEQGKYLEMHDRLLRNQQPQTLDQLNDHARALNMDIPVFERCLNEQRYAARVRRDIEEGTKNKVQGTPTFFVGTLDDEGSQLKAVTKVYGAQPYAAFQKALAPLFNNGPADPGLLERK